MKRRMSSPISSTGGSPSKDCGIMASGSADAPASPESSDASEECPGKKKSRFQTFKNFFAKKKRKEAAGLLAESSGVQLKSSQSIEDVNVPDPATIHTDKDSDSSSNIHVGSKALSQDSVFTSDPPSPETKQALQSSQDSIHGKVKSLQMQLKQAIRLGSAPAVISMKKTEDGGVSEDDGLPCSPPEYSTTHTVLTTSSQRSSAVVQRSGSLSLEGSDSDDDQMSGASSRPWTPQTSIPVDFSEPASSLSCLDSSAAHHRIAVKSRACAKRKPASREMVQPKRRDLRERVLLRDTEDKLRASRTSREEDDNIFGEEINEVRQDSPGSLSVLTQNERDLPASSQSQRSSTTTSASGEVSEDDEFVPDKDHVASSGILETSWANSVTLELNTDDFLLDGGCEVVVEEQGSLLEEVLSSLKGPLVSSLVLESDATVKQMEVEDTSAKDVLDKLDVDSTTDRPDSTDPASILDDQVHDEYTLPESVTFPQAAESVEQEKEVPVEQELADDIPFEEDLQLLVMEVYEVEDNQVDRKDLTEEVAEDSEIMDCAGEEVVMEQEDEDTKIEEHLDEEEEQENDEDAEEEINHEEEFLVGDDKDGKGRNEEDDEFKSHGSCPLEDEAQEIKLDTSIKIKSFYEIGESVEGSTSVSKEVVNQSEDLIAHECTEQPSFVVMTSLELSFPKKTSPLPKETEDVYKFLQEVTNEQHDSLVKCDDCPTESLQVDVEHSEKVHHEEVLTETHHSSMSESEAAEESLQDTSDCTADEEPVFNNSPSRDQSSVSMTAEQSASQGQTRSLPSSPLSTFQKEICQADEDTTPENPFGIRLRKTPVLHRYASEGDSPTLNTEPVETQKSPFLEQLSRKPVLPKKPDQGADGVVKPKKTSDLAKESVENSESPSWISLARQKQKVFKENSLDESLGESKVSAQEELNKKGLLDYLPGPDSKDQLKPVASPVKVSCSLEISKPVLEKRSISHPVPAPLTQDEPPWLALAKKKAKAWSEMPQIVQ